MLASLLAETLAGEWLVRKRRPNEWSKSALVGLRNFSYSAKREKLSISIVIKSARLYLYSKVQSEPDCETAMNNLMYTHIIIVSVECQPLHHSFEA